MRLGMMTVLVAVLVLAGCGGDDAATTTTVAPTTTVASRSDIGKALAEAADPGGDFPYLAAEPVVLAGIAGQYCADLDKTNALNAGVALESSLYAYLMEYAVKAPNGDPSGVVQLVQPKFAAATHELLCPKVGGDEYLPDN